MDIRHFYLEQGQGTPLVLLHGNGESSAYFEYQMEAFSKEYHVFALDTRGHGQTPRGQAPFTLSQFAEDLSGFMQEHGIEKAHLLGFSDGGNIALLFALRNPEKVDRLILNGANLFPGGVKRSTQIPIEIGYRLANLFAKRNMEAKRNAELLGLMVHEPDIAPEELKTVKARTLVIAGTKDMIREKHTKLIAASLPDAELAILPGDHFVARKNPEAFNRTVLEFLKD